MAGVTLSDGVTSQDLAAHLTDLRTDINAIDSITGAVAVSNIAAMTALAKSGLTDDDVVIVKGYYEPGDDGGGTFRWDASSTATTNVGLCFAADEGGTGRWLRDLSQAESLNVRWFGAKIDGVTDDTVAIQAAINDDFGKVFIPATPTSTGGCIVSQLYLHQGTKLFGTAAVSKPNRGSHLVQKPGTNLSLIVPASYMVPGGTIHGAQIANLFLIGDDAATAGCGIDITCRTGENFLIENVIAHSFAESGIRLKNGHVPGAVFNCAAFANAEYGFDFQRGGGDPRHQFSVRSVSGDNNGIALIRIKTAGGPFDQITIENVKAESWEYEGQTNGLQPDVIVLDTTNYVPIVISNVTHQSNFGSDSIVRIIGTGARVIAKNFRATTNCTNWFSDETNGIDMPRGAVGDSNAMLQGIWDSSQHDPTIHIQTKDDYHSVGRVTQRGSAAPTTGTHYAGEIVYNTAPSAGGTVGWICVTAGTPGTWKTFGAISA